MPIQPTHNHLPKLLLGITLLVTICIFSCNGSGSSTETKDSTVVKDSTTIKDTTKMKMDSTMKTDTSGKGGQQTPTGK
jgi:hypothetical protein